jgi:hypothetical protein
MAESTSDQLLLTKGVSGILEHVRREILSGNTTLDALSYERLSGSNDAPKLFHDIESLLDKDCSVDEISEMLSGALSNIYNTSNPQDDTCKLFPLYFFL